MELNIKSIFNNRYRQISDSSPSLFRDVMAAVANENLRANLIYGEIYFVSFDFTRGIYFNMLFVSFLQYVCFPI